MFALIGGDYRVMSSLSSMKGPMMTRRVLKNALTIAFMVDTVNGEGDCSSARRQPFAQQFGDQFVQTHPAGFGQGAQFPGQFGQ